jgi:hypothetical protein
VVNEVAKNEKSRGMHVHCIRGIFKNVVTAIFKIVFYFETSNCNMAMMQLLWHHLLNSRFLCSHRRVFSVFYLFYFRHAIHDF